MSDYKRGDPIPYLNDGADLFGRPLRRAEKGADPRARLASLEKQRADILSKHQRTLMQFQTRAVKSGNADELEALEQQLADVEGEIKAVRESIAGVGEYLDGHVAAVKTQHEQRQAAARQDAGWDYLLTRKAGQYDESKHRRHPKGSGENAGRFAPKGGGAVKKPSSAIVNHPNYSWSDYDALKTKGHSDDEIIEIWEKDRARGWTTPLKRKPIPDVSKYFRK